MGNSLLMQAVALFILLKSPSRSNHIGFTQHLRSNHSYMTSSAIHPKEILL